MLYYGLFHEKQHYLTIRDRRTDKGYRKLLSSQKQLNKLVNEQKSYQDYFITKYPVNKMVECIILDFDAKSKAMAFHEATLCRDTVMSKGLNAVMVNSTNKGYHLYIQVPPHLFKRGVNVHINKEFDWNYFFKEYVNHIILKDEPDFNYRFLDEVNTNAGLNGNIRVIGSIHPSTGERVRIVKGEFINDPEPTTEEFEAYNHAKDLALCKLKYDEFKKEKGVKCKKITNDSSMEDPVEGNDLRELLPTLFGSDIKMYPRDYGYMFCPFHNDNHRSLLVTKEYYSCSACGEKGNWWTLRKKGLVKFDNE